MSRLLLYRSRNRWKCTCSKNISCGALKIAELLNDFSIVHKCKKGDLYLTNVFEYEIALITRDLNYKKRNHRMINHFIFHRYIDLAYKLVIEMINTRCLLCNKQYKSFQLYTDDSSETIRWKLKLACLASKSNINVELFCYQDSEITSVSRYLKCKNITFTIDSNTQYHVGKEEDRYSICQNIHSKFKY